MNVTERGPNAVAISFTAGELLVIVNALEDRLHVPDPEEAEGCRRVQRPLLDALRYLRPKASLREGHWTTDWARGEDGKHL